VYRVKKLITVAKAQQWAVEPLIIATGLVVRVPGYRSRGPDSIPGAARFSEK
jgi:hypothetical protein